MNSKMACHISVLLAPTYKSKDSRFLKTDYFKKRLYDEKVALITCAIKHNLL